MSTQNEIELLYHLEWIRKHFEEPSDGSLGITIVGMDGIEVSKWMKKVGVQRQPGGLPRSSHP